MKINFVVPGLMKTGGMRVVRELGLGLADRGHSVVIYSPLLPYNFHKGEFSMNAVRQYLWNLKANKKLLDNKDFFESSNLAVETPVLIGNRSIRNADVVIATAWPTAFSIRNLSAGKGKKFYFIQDYETWNSNIKEVDKSYRLGLDSITTCKYLQRKMNEKFGIDSSIVFCGIDSKLFNPSKKVLKKEKTITFIHNELDKKNTPAALEIISRIREKYPDVKFVSFGIMPYRNLPEYIETYVNPNEDQIRKIYKNTDIFLFTSKEEGFGLPPSEAMASRAAVVTTNVGAIPEFCENNFSAFMHEPNDIKGMTESIEKLLNDDNLLQKMSEAGHNTVSGLMDWNKSVIKFENIISQ